MPNYLTKEEIRQWRSSLEKITLEEFAARLGKTVEEKNTIDLYDKGLLSDTSYDAIKDSKYKIFRNATGAAITLERGTSWGQDMIVTKSLANKDDNVYDNSLEILKIDGKTARTIQESKDGEQIEKSYKPGNYIPTSTNNEQDDDIVEVILTPPTGAGNYIITYLIAGVAGLIVLAVAVIFIKKKVLTK